MKKEEVEKYKIKIKEIAKNEQIISGIHNYCDRWCEKCTKTVHCSVFLMENTEKDEKKDINNEKFWEKLSVMFQATFEMITENAKKRGIDLKNIEDVEYKEIEFNKTKLQKIAVDYGMKIVDWLKINNEVLKEKAENILLINEKKLLEFTDAIEVVKWYSLFIGAKTHRATSPNDFDNEFELDDKLGTTKIALIAIDRSIEALSFIYKEIPEKEYQILDFLVLLSKLKKGLEAKFPEARNFKRPGFD